MIVSLCSDEFDIFADVCRTLGTPSAVSSGASSPSERGSLVGDFRLHLHVSTCSSSPTTARKASYVTSCATLSVWTQALSSPNSVASGQSAQEGCIIQSDTKQEAQLTCVGAFNIKGASLKQNRTLEGPFTSFFVSFIIWMSSKGVSSS